MSRNRPVDRDTAEQMLRGERHHDRLSRLLAAAAAPARPGELDGEPAAVAAFRAARVGATAPRKRSLVARLLPLKIAAATVTVTAVGGVALATGTGALPTPGGSEPAGTGQLATGEMSASSPAPSSPAADRSTAPAHGGGAGPHSSPPSQEEAAALADLCRAYPRVDRKDTDRLAEAAGGRHKIIEYCVQFLATRPGDSRRPATPSGTPSTSPSPSPERTPGPGSRGDSSIVAPSVSPSTSTRFWRPPHG